MTAHWLCIIALAASGQTPKAELVQPVQKIWDQAAHNAFTDLIRFDERWFCVFREGTGHAAGAGKIRVLTSTDGAAWSSAALLEWQGVDLRDPHISQTPEGKLMIIGGAAEPATRDPVKDHYSFVSFSKDGKEWSKPERVGPSWHWLWRATWDGKNAYTVAYHWDPKVQGKYRAKLMRSGDGIQFEKIIDFDVPQATEATLVFDGTELYCLQRRDGKPNSAKFGFSQPPYTKWAWADLDIYFGGPNFIKGPGGTWWATGRTIDKGKAQTVLWQLDVNVGKLTPVLTLPSGGDTSYPGMAWHQGELWISYYSSHEGKSNIYLARVRLTK
jgi:hypothetical protein